MSDGYGRRLLIDNSAWSRIIGGRYPDDLAERWLAGVAADEIFVCEPFRTEALYSARTAAEYEAMSRELDAFPQASADATTWRLALEAQARLAADRRVSHRAKVIDLLVAATAARHGVGVLHYDRDFDVIADRGGLDYESRWIAPRGSLA